MARKKKSSKGSALVLGAATVVASSAVLAELAAAETPEQRVERFAEGLDQASIEISYVGPKGDEGFQKAFEKEFDQDVPV